MQEHQFIEHHHLVVQLLQLMLELKPMLKLKDQLLISLFDLHYFQLKPVIRQQLKLQPVPEFKLILQEKVRMHQYLLVKPKP